MGSPRSQWWRNSSPHYWMARLSLDARAKGAPCLSPRIPQYSKHLSIKRCIRLAVHLCRIPGRQEMRKMKAVKERGFSVEMASKEHVRSLIISDESQGKVLFEGNLGELQTLEMVEGIVLQVRGTNGTLRIDLEEGEFRRMLEKKNKGDEA